MWYGFRMPSAHDVVAALHADLFGRGGFDAWWDDIDPTTQREIVTEHEAIVARALDEADPSRIPHDELSALSLGRGRDRR
jgi:hypothetical protein